MKIANALAVALVCSSVVANALTQYDDETLRRAGIEPGDGKVATITSTGRGLFASNNECEFGNWYNWSDRAKKCPTAAASRFGNVYYDHGECDGGICRASHIDELGSNYTIARKTIDEGFSYVYDALSRRDVFTIDPAKAGKDASVYTLNISLQPCSMGDANQSFCRPVWLWNHEVTLQKPKNPLAAGLPVDQQWVWINAKRLFAKENKPKEPNNNGVDWDYDNVILTDKPVDEVFKVKAWAKANSDWVPFEKTKARFLPTKHPGLSTDGKVDIQGVYMALPKEGNHTSRVAEIPLTFQADRCANDVLYEITVKKEYLNWIWEETGTKASSRPFIYQTNNEAVNEQFKVHCVQYKCPKIGPRLSTAKFATVDQLCFPADPDNARCNKRRCAYCMSTFNTLPPLEITYSANYFLNKDQVFYLKVTGRPKDADIQKCVESVEVKDIAPAVSTLYQSLASEFDLVSSVERKDFVRGTFLPQDVNFLNGQNKRAPGVLTRLDGDNIALGFNFAQGSFKENANYDPAARFLIVDSETFTQVSWNNSIAEDVTAQNDDLPAAVDSTLGASAKVFDIEEMNARGMLKTAYATPYQVGGGDMVVFLQNVRLNHAHTRELKMYVVNAVKEKDQNGKEVWTIHSKQQILHDPLTLRPRSFDFTGARVVGGDLQLVNNFADVDSLLASGEYVFDKAIIHIIPQCNGLDGSKKCIKNAAGKYTKFSFASDFGSTSAKYSAKPTFVGAASSLVAPLSMGVQVIDSTVENYLSDKGLTPANYCRTNNATVKDKIAYLMARAKGLTAGGLSVDGFAQEIENIKAGQSGWENNIVGSDGKIACGASGYALVSAASTPSVSTKVAVDRRARVTSLLPNSSNFGATISYELGVPNHASFEIAADVEEDLKVANTGDMGGSVVLKELECDDEKCSCQETSSCKKTAPREKITFKADEVNAAFFKRLDELCTSLECSKTTVNGPSVSTQAHSGSKLSSLDRDATQKINVYLGDALDEIEYDKEIPTKEFWTDLNENKHLVRLNFFGASPKQKAFTTEIAGQQMLVTVPLLRFKDQKTDASATVQILPTQNQVLLGYTTADGNAAKFAMPAAGHSCKDELSGRSLLDKPCYDAQRLGMPGFEINTADRVRLLSSYRAKLEFVGTKSYAAGGSAIDCAPESFNLAKGTCCERGDYDAASGLCCASGKTASSGKCAAAGTEHKGVSERIENGYWKYHATDDKSSFKDIISCAGPILCEEFSVVFEKQH